MDTSWIGSVNQLLLLNLVPFIWRLIGAVILWIIGGWAINLARRLFTRAMRMRGLDATLTEYLESAMAVVLRILLIIAILSLFGIETASFAALIAAAGVAIGMAWSGLLANFAAGIFLILLRPVRVGDFITAAGVTGTVREIGMFATVIDQPDNVRTVVGNNKLFSDNIVNFSTNAYRRVDLTAQLAHDVNAPAAIDLLRTRIAQIPNVLTSPAPDIDVLEINPAGTKLVVRPYASNDHYWQVFFDTNRAIMEVSGQAGWPIPAPHQVLLQRQ
ncbi:MAG: mechanosensitive ion channel family protein [Rhodocyclaceae bacterium]